MQRKASKSTRGVNAAEKRFAEWVKNHDCCICSAPAPSIVDHVLGSSAKIKHGVTVLVGPWVLLPLCYTCDQVKTAGSHRHFVQRFGKHQVDYWLELVRGTGRVPDDIIEAVESRHYG